jgi:hypothetical protein
MASRRLPTHPIVEKLGGTDAIKLLGYIGSTAQGTVKVYLSLDDLSAYYQINEADILHVAEAPAEELPYGGSAIWVKADAAVEYCVSQRTSMQARFLAGDIASRMAKGPGVAYRAYAQQGVVPETGGGGACEGFSVWPCSVAWGACLASNDMPCVNTKQYWCPREVYTAASCFTCAGYTCVGPCYSAGCPPTRHLCTGTQPTRCCQVYSRDVCRDA